jgi:hypothetical protein
LEKRWGRGQSVHGVAGRAAEEGRTAVFLSGALREMFPVTEKRGRSGEAVMRTEFRSCLLGLRASRPSSP